MSAPVITRSGRHLFSIHSKEVGCRKEAVARVDSSNLFGKS
jgi:hypothetical protein